MSTNNLPGLPSEVPPMKVSWERMSRIPRNKRIPFAVREYLSQSTTNHTIIFRYFVDTLLGAVESGSKSPVTKRYCKWARSTFSLMEMHKIVKSMVQISVPSVQKRCVDNSLEAIWGRVLVRYFEFQGVDQTEVDNSMMSVDFVLSYCLKLSDEVLLKHGFTVALRDTFARDEYGSTEVMFVLQHEVFGKIALLFVASSNLAGNSRGFRGSAKRECNIYTESKCSGPMRQAAITEFMEACIEHFCTTLDTRENFIMIPESGELLTAKKRDMTDVVVSTFDYDDFLYKIQWSLDRRSKHSCMLVGNPGLGKSVAIHKLMADLHDIPIVVMSPMHPDALNAQFQMLRNFPQFVLVLDDFEKFDVAEKNSRGTGVFLRQLEDTSGFQGIIVSVVNDPSLVEPALRRPGRLGDSVYLVDYPSPEPIAVNVAKKLAKMGHPEIHTTHPEIITEFAKRMCGAKFSYAGIDRCIENFVMLLDRDKTKDGYDHLHDLANQAIDTMLKGLETLNLESDNGELRTRQPRTTKQLDERKRKIARYDEPASECSG